MKQENVVQAEYLIPHRRHMKLLERIVNPAPKELQAETTVAESWPLAKEGSVSSLLCVELVAQANPRHADETMLYVHVAESHMRELPEAIRSCMSGLDPDARIIKMLRARADARGPNWAKTEALECESRMESAG